MQHMAPTHCATRWTVLIEAKGPNIAKFVKASTGTLYDCFRGPDSFVDQARRQVAAVQGVPVPWVFAEARAATAVAALTRS